MINNIPQIQHLSANNFFLIAGPCAVESESLCMEVAEKVKVITDKLQIPHIFKGS
ncbi:MAG: hypothetical protein AB8B69_20085 [Chitinophagales bacterium]